MFFNLFSKINMKFIIIFILLILISNITSTCDVSEGLIDNEYYIQMESIEKCEYFGSARCERWFKHKNITKVEWILKPKNVNCYINQQIQGFISYKCTCLPNSNKYVSMNAKLKVTLKDLTPDEILTVGLTSKPKSIDNDDMNGLYTTLILLVILLVIVVVIAIIQTPTKLKNK
jgi:ABC-type uncharacterized transport system fused permease/ATPase subunit